MPWSLQNREGQWHVMDDDGSSVGVHDSRVDAIKHQRYLYANASRVASIYDALDERTVGWAEPTPEAAVSPLALELVTMLAKSAEEKALVASVAQAREEQQRVEAQEERHALVAALGRLGSPVINLPAQAAPEVTVHVPPAEVTFHAPAPEVNVHVPPAEVTVNTPDIHVNVEAPPAVQKTMTMVRDPLTQQVTSVEVTEQ